MVKQAATTPPKRTKNQHYVPRMHLQHFVGDTPKNMVWTFDNERERWWASTVENTGAQTNFYSVIDEDGNRVDLLDETLRQIESKAAAGYADLLAGTVPTDQARADFSMFVATQFCRTPAMINAYAAGHAETADLQLDILLASRESFEKTAAAYQRDTGNDLGDYDTLRSFHADKSRYTIAVHQKRGLKALAIADDLAPLLYRRTWYIVDAQEGFFITSDNPVFRWVPPEAIHPIYGDGGFKNIKAEVSFPLSRSRLLLMTGQDGSVGTNGPHLQASRDVVDQMNRLRAYAAERCVYSPIREAAIAKMAMDHREHKTRFQISHTGDRPNVIIDRKVGN